MYDLNRIMDILLGAFICCAIGLTYIFIYGDTSRHDTTGVTTINPTASHFLLMWERDGEGESLPGMGTSLKQCRETASLLVAEYPNIYNLTCVGYDRSI